MKKRIAALLRRWAYALNPENSRTLPPGYEVQKLEAYDCFRQPEAKPGERFRQVPDAETTRRIRAGLVENLIKQLRNDPDCVRVRAEISPVPGGLVEYRAALYVGVSLQAKRRREFRESSIRRANERRLQKAYGKQKL